MDRKAGYILSVSIASVLVLTAWVMPGALFTNFVTYPKLFAIQTLALPALVVLLPALLRENKINWWLWALGGYLAWTVISLLWTDWRGGTNAHLAREVPYYVLAALAFYTARNRNRVLKVLSWFLIALLGASVLQVLSIVSHHGATGKELRQCFYENPLPFGNVNFATPHLIVGMLLAASVTFLQGSRLRRLRTRKKRLVLAALLAGSAFSLVLFFALFWTAGSLAGWVAFAVASACYLAAVSPLKNKRRLAVSAVVLALLAALTISGVPAMRTRLLGWALRPDSTAQVRVVTGLAATDMMTARPLTGWGAGTFAAVYPRFEPTGARELYYVRSGYCSHPHIEVLRVGSELGVPGALLFLLLTLGALIGAAVRIPGLPRKARLMGWALWAGVIAYLVETTFDVGLFFWDVAPVFWILCGMLAGYGHRMKPLPAQRSRTGRILELLIVTFAIVAGVWAWHAYGLGGYRSQLLLTAAAKDMKKSDPDSMRHRLVSATKHCTTPWHVLVERVRNGYLYRRQERFVAAVGAYRTVLDIAPEFLSVRLYLAECYFRLGRFRDAYPEAVQYVSRRPKNPAGHSLLARILIAAGPEADLALVAAELQLACELSKYERKSDALLLVDILTGQGRLSEAEDFVGKVKDAGKTYWPELDAKLKKR